MVPNAMSIIAAATAALGVVEEPFDSNDGASLRKLLADTAFAPGESWCLFFAEHCVKQGFGDPLQIPAWISLDGSCQNCADKADGEGKLSEFAATGCIFLLPNHAGHFHHAGIVTSVDESTGTFSSIEGNSNAPGSEFSTGVWRHHRFIHSCKFVIW